MWHNKEEQQAEAYWQAQARFEKLERMKNKGWGEKPSKQSAEEFDTQGKAGMMLKQQADYIDQLEKGLESSIAMNKAQAERFAELERRYKEEFNYAEKLLKERNI